MEAMFIGLVLAGAGAIVAFAGFAVVKLFVGGRR
jgi:hypothetical protein